MSDPFTLYRLAESLRAEFRDRHLTSAEGSSRKHGRKVGDVKDGRNVQVADESGKPIEIGRPGELVARGANVMRGY